MVFFDDAKIKKKQYDASALQKKSISYENRHILSKTSIFAPK